MAALSPPWTSRRTGSPQARADRTPSAPVTPNPPWLWSRICASTAPPAPYPWLLLTRRIASTPTSPSRSARCEIFWLCARYILALLIRSHVLIVSRTPTGTSLTWTSNSSPFGARFRGRQANRLSVSARLRRGCTTAKTTRLSMILRLGGECDV